MVCWTRGWLLACAGGWMDGARRAVARGCAVYGGAGEAQRWGTERSGDAAAVEAVVSVFCAVCALASEVLCIADWDAPVHAPARARTTALKRWTSDCTAHGMLTMGQYLQLRRQGDDATALTPCGRTRMAPLRRLQSLTGWPCRKESWPNCARRCALALHGPCLFRVYFWRYDVCVRVCVCFVRMRFCRSGGTLVNRLWHARRVALGAWFPPPFFFGDYKKKKKSAKGESARVAHRRCWPMELLR